MAYLDGQLSASESLDFEESLSARERMRLDGEVRLESAISDSLTVSDCCPVVLWNKLATQMRDPGTGKSWRLTNWLPHTFMVLAATAAIVITGPPLMEYLQRGSQVAPSSLEISQSEEEFRSQSEVPPTFAAAQAYLHNHDINLKLVHLAKSAAQHHHQIEFVGVCEGKCPERTLFELRFICCGKPAKVLVAKLGTAGERMLRAAGSCGEVRETRVSDEFITAVVCGHDTPELLDLVQPVHGNLT